MTTAGREMYDGHLQTILVALGEREIGLPVEVCFKANNGGGFLGIVDAVDLKGKHGDLHLIVKSASINKEVRENIPLGECVEAELKFYEVVVPVIEKFCMEKGVKHVFSGIPKCFCVERFNDYEVIIMENLKVQGYDTWDSMRPMPGNNAEMIMHEYGKFHALSFAFKYECPKEYTSLADQLGDNISNWMTKGKMLGACINNLRKMKESVSPMIFEKLSKLIDGIPEYMLQHNFKSDEYAVISHADCWCNNMMFKYKDGTNVLESAKLIDFQLSRSSPFMCDIVQFLSACCDHTVWNNVEHYLKVYHVALTNMLQELGSAKVITFDQVLQQFKKYAKYGLILSAFFLKVTLMKPHETPTIIDTVSGKFIEKFSKIENDHSYTERLKFLIEYYYKHELF